ncbi:MAG: hypothetical protein IJQ31_13330 [Thermoguttaceae bacterium]|nr:hypothetical protein [Thermoguttaceae bacterium]
MDWQDREQISPRVTWQYALCTFVALCIAAMVSYSIGSPENETKSSPSDSARLGLVSIPFEKNGTSSSLELPPEFHPWGAFESGTWCLSRTIVEGRRLGRISPKTYTESNVFLLDKQKNNYTTLTESSIMLAGKNIQKEPKTTQTDLFGLPVDGSRRVEELPSETLTIEGVPVVCRVLKIVSVSGRYLREIQVWFNETTEPYIFRKMRNTFRSPSNVCIERMVQNVTSTHLQFSLGGQVMSGYRYTQTSSYPTYISKSEVVASLAVPGRIVTQITHESDRRGRPLQDISTELLDFGSNSEEYQARVSRSSVHSSRLIITPTSSNTETGSEKTAEKNSVVEQEISEETELSPQNPLMGGQRHISVEFSLSNEESADDPEPASDAENSILEPTPVPESSGKPAPAETLEPVPAANSGTKSIDSVKLEDFVSPLALVTLSQNAQGTSAVSGRGMRMEPGCFQEFQLSWQIGKELLAPNSHVEIGRLFPNLPGANWGKFLQNRNLLPNVFQRLPQRTEEKPQQEPEDF